MSGNNPKLKEPLKPGQETNKWPSPPDGTGGVRAEVWWLYEYLVDNIGQDLTVTSGYRTPTHNKAVGGAKNSAHLRGWAIDIACTNDELRQRIISQAIHYGVLRIGLYPHHVHLDLDASLPSPVAWLGHD